MLSLVRKYKKLFLELKYLYAELEYYEEELEEAQTNFKEAFYEKCEQLNLNLKKPQQTFQQDSAEISTNVHTFEEKQHYEEQTPIAETQTEESKTDDEEISKLYKKIVFLTHPDSIPAGEKEQLKQKRTKQFLLAQEAYRNKNWFLICEIAMELGVDIPEPNKKQLKWIEEESSKVKERISHIKSLYAWAWHTSENNKDGIMEHYVKSVVK